MKTAHIFLLFLSLSCWSFAQQRTLQRRAEWTIMVYMNAKNNLECEALDNFGQMATVGSTERINVLTELGRPHEHYQCGDRDPWQGVLRFRVKKDQVPTSATAEPDPKHEVGESTDMGSAYTLVKFVSWARDQYPANHYALIIWNHGQGWRFQTARNAALRLSGAKGRLPNQAAIPEKARPVGGFRSVSFDDDTKNFLYNGDIQVSLSALLKGSKLDLIGFDACLMAMMETAYAMRGIAQVMVGSEELEPGAGWDYGEWLSRLGENPAIGPFELGQILVDSYQQAYKNRLRATLSALNLAQMDELAGHISAMSRVLQNGLVANLVIIKAARQACANYGEAANMRNPIDLHHFVDQIIRGSNNAQLTAAARDVREFLETSQVVISNYASSRSKGNYGSYGISIYFPASKADFEADPDNAGYQLGNPDHPVEFVQSKDQVWAKFLHAYLGRIPE